MKSKLARIGAAVVLLTGSAFSAVAFVIGAASLPAPPPTSPSGPLVVEVPEVDLGTLRQGVSSRAAFVVESRSDKPVLIARIRLGCTCTSHTLSQSRIGPGESATLELVYDSGSSRGDFAPGASVYYFVEGAEELHRLDVALRVRVEPDIRLSEERMTFDSGKAGERLLSLVARENTEFRIEELSCTHSAFSAELQPAILPGRHEKVLVRFDPSRWSDQRQRVELLIRTDSQVEPLLRIRLVARRG